MKNQQVVTRINRLEKRLESMDDPEARHRIERRLVMLRLAPEDRIRVLEQRLVRNPNNHRLRVRLERLKGEKTPFEEKKPIAERIRVLESMLERSDVPQRDILAARLMLLQIQSQNGPMNRSERVQRLKARLVLNPDQPGLRDRLEHLQRRHEERKQQAPPAKETEEGMCRRPLLHRIETLERELSKVDNAEDRMALETELDHVRNRLWRRQARNGKEQTMAGNKCGASEPGGLAESRRSVLLARIQKLERKLNETDNAEERMAFETHLDRVRNKLWRFEAKVDGTGMEINKTIIEKDMTG